MKKLLVLALCLVTMGLVTANANASVTLITNLSQFIASIPNELVENFDDAILNPELSIQEFGGAGSIHDGVYQNIVDDAQQRYQIFTFTGPISGFGVFIDLAGPGGPGSGIEVSLPELGVVVGEIPNTYAGQFWGFMSTSAFTQVMFSEGSGVAQETYYNVDLHYSQAVPVPAAVWLLGSGLVGLVGLRRKLRG